MPISSLFSVEGSTAVQAHAVAYGATVDLVIQSLTGVETIAWSIVSTSFPDQTAPTITLAGTPSGATASFPQIADPGDGMGRAYLVKLTVSSQREGSHTTYRVVGTVNAAGTMPVCPDEKNYRHPTNGWAHVVNQALLAGSFAGTFVHVATTAALPANTRTVNDYQADANGAITSASTDGVTPFVGMRILAKDEATAANRGVLRLVTLGSAGTPWTATRDADFDASADFASGKIVQVQSGTLNLGRRYVLTVASSFTLNTDAVTFTLYAASGVFDVLIYGADPTGVADSQAAFQAALNAAEEGGLVVVPPGVYRLNSGVTVKAGVTLTGPEHGIKQGHRLFAGLVEKTGALIKAYGTGRLFTLDQQSVVCNLEVWYPDQNTNSAPIAHDYTFYIGAQGCSVYNISAINPDKLAYVNTDGVYIGNVIAGPLTRGITLARCGDVTRIVNVHFNPNVNDDTGATLLAYIQQNLFAFVIDGAEEFNFTNCFCVICLIGFCFNDEDADSFPSYGSIVGGGIDYAAGCIQVLNGLALSTLRVSNFSMVPTPSSTPVIGAGNAIKMQDNVASPTFKPTIMIENFDIHGEHNRSFWLDGNSNGRIVARDGVIGAGVLQNVALAEKAVDGYKGGVIELDRVGSLAAAVRPATAPASCGAGQLSDTNGFVTDEGAFLQSGDERGGALLADADATITIAGGAWRVMPPKTLTANRTVDIDNGAESDNETITIDRQDIEAFTLTIRDNANAIIATFPVSIKMRGKFRKAAGANFVCEKLTRLT